jgi:hypothetical protein
MFLFRFQQILFWPSIAKQPFPLHVKADDKNYLNECKSLIIVFHERFPFLKKNACDIINQK